MNVKLHSDKCITCGMCTSIAPNLFSIDTGVVALKKDPKTYTEEDWKKAKEAAASCPAEAIEISENS